MQKPRIRLVAILACVLTIVSLASPGDVRAQGAVIYDDQLHWANWSWGTSLNTQATSPVFDGSNSMRVEYQRGWAGASFHGGSFDTTGFNELRIAIHPGGNPIPNLGVALYDQNGNVITNIDPRNYAQPAGNGWHLVTIPLADLQAQDRIVSRIHIREFAGIVPPAFHIDALAFATTE